MNDYEVALTWWYTLSLSEQTLIEKKFGYYGHDIGTTEEDVVYFYKQLFRNKEVIKDKTE